MIENGSTCPHCGQRQRDPQVRYNGLRPVDRRLFARLCERQAVSAGSLIEQLWGDDPEGGPLDAANSLHAHISRLRRFLQPRGVRIVCVRSRHPGESLYGIPPEDRAAAREILATYDEKMVEVRA